MNHCGEEELLTFVTKPKGLFDDVAACKAERVFRAQHAVVLRRERTKADGLDQMSSLRHGREHMLLTFRETHPRGFVSGRTNCQAATRKLRCGALYTSFWYKAIIFRRP